MEDDTKIPPTNTCLTIISIISLFAVVHRLPMCLQIGFSAKSLAALRTSVHLHHARMFFLSVAKQGSLGLEKFAAIGAS